MRDVLLRRHPQEARLEVRLTRESMTEGPPDSSSSVEARAAIESQSRLRFANPRSARSWMQESSVGPSDDAVVYGQTGGRSPRCAAE